jgi:phosphohistidine phosphatase
MRDADRALTPEGKKKLREVLQVARRAEVRPELILTSPFKRARETAEIAADVLGYKGQVASSVHITPMGDVREAWAELRTMKDVPSILVSSHEPFCSLMFSYLLGCSHLMVDVKKGAMMRIDVADFGAQPRGVLKWMLTPKLAG